MIEDIEREIDKNKAIKNLEELGLSSYEAKTLIALHRLGRGTAREIYRVSDVPRSQIYGAAEELEKKGLIEIQRSKPMKFRPCELEETEKRLEEEFKTKKDGALSYIQEVQSDLLDTSEEKEDVWTIHGYETVTRRIIDIIENAQNYIILSFTEQKLLDKEILRELEEKSEEGVDIRILYQKKDIKDDVIDESKIEVIKPPETLRRKDAGGRLIVADGESTLLSVISEDKEMHHPEYESAIWSQNTEFSKVLVQLIESWLGETLPD